MVLKNNEESEEIIKESQQIEPKQDNCAYKELLESGISAIESGIKIISIALEQLKNNAEKCN